MVFTSCDRCISILAVLLICSLGGPLSHGSPVVVFLADRGHSCLWNFNFTVPIDVIRVKSYVNYCFLMLIPSWLSLPSTSSCLRFAPNLIASLTVTHWTSTTFTES